MCNAETRIDKITNVRGLYTSRQFSDLNEPLIRIPNKLIICPYHIKHQIFNGNWQGYEGPSFQKEYLTKRLPYQKTYE